MKHIQEFARISCTHHSMRMQKLTINQSSILVIINVRLSITQHSNCIVAMIQLNIHSNRMTAYMLCRAGGTEWAGWAIALPDLAVDAIYNY